MSAAAKSTQPVSPATHRANIIKLMKSNAYHHNLYDVFRDFCEMASLAISNSIDLLQRQEREARYMAIVKRYSKEEVNRFPQMLGELTMALEIEPGDVLGQLFGELELGNSARGQFFTPYSVCQAMAQLQVGDGASLQEIIKQRGFVTVSEPTVGAGAMVVAMAEAFRAKGINYQQHMHVTAQDIDSRAVHMAYLQFSLLHIPAIVILGNTLMVEEKERWVTPAHAMGMWPQKLARGYALDSGMDEAPEVEVIPIPLDDPAPTLPAFMPPPAPAGEFQLTLF